MARGPGGRWTCTSPIRAPAGAPLVVFLYGGSWRTGSKSVYAFAARPLARRGAVVVVPGLPAVSRSAVPRLPGRQRQRRRLGREPRRGTRRRPQARVHRRPFRRRLQRGDAGASIRGTWRRPGWSGGRSRASPPWPGRTTSCRSTDPDIIPVFAAVNDGPASQPITYADGRNPPMLLLAGDADTTVRPRNTQNLAAKNRSPGRPGREQAVSGRRAYRASSPPSPRCSAARRRRWTTCGPSSSGIEGRQGMRRNRSSSPGEAALSTGSPFARSK